MTCRNKLNPLQLNLMLANEIQTDLTSTLSLK